MKKPYETPNLVPIIKEKIMALSEVEDQDELIEEFEDIDNYINENERKGALAGWLISISTHAVVLLVLMSVVIAAKVITENPSTKSVYIQNPEIPKMEEEIKKLEEIETVVTHTEEVTEDVTVMTDLEIEEIEVEKITTEDQEVSNEPKGREDAVSDSEMGSNWNFAALGAGGGGKGAFGRKIGGDKRRIGKAYGPNSRGAASALEAALRWLKRHQSDNGQWDSDNYFLNCTLDGPKGEPGKNVNGADEALTGYALLCFLGAGYDHKIPNQYRNTIKKGLDWIVANQNQNGLIGHRNYEHPVATMALAEAYAMTMDPSLKVPTENAIEIILSRQVKSNEGDDAYDGLGWDYVAPKMTRQDSSVSGWNVMALKSAKAAGIDIQNGLHGSKKWLEGAWKAANPGWETLDPYGESVFPYTWNGTTNETKKDHLSFIGSLCAVFLGYQSGDVILDTMNNDMDKRWFDTEKYKTNSYSLYYCSLASYMNGTSWKEKWGNPDTGFVPWLIETQLEGGCQDGTWPHEKENFHGWDTSPILTHVYKTLAIEVAYRYLPLSAKQ